MDQIVLIKIYCAIRSHFNPFIHPDSEAIVPVLVMSRPSAVSACAVVESESKFIYLLAVFVWQYLYHCLGTVWSEYLR